MPPIAHVTHWSMYILYGVPVLIVLASIFVNAIRERRGRGAEGEGPA